MGSQEDFTYKQMDPSYIFTIPLFGHMESDVSNHGTLATTVMVQSSVKCTNKRFLEIMFSMHFSTGH